MANPGGSLIALSDKSLKTSSLVELQPIMAIKASVKIENLNLFIIISHWIKSLFGQQISKGNVELLKDFTPDISDCAKSWMKPHFKVTFAGISR